MKGITLTLFALFLLVTCHSSLVTALRAQEAVLSVPLHKSYTYSVTQPLFSLQHAPGATGHLQDWKNTSGVVTLYVDANGNLVNSGSAFNLFPAVRPAGAYAYLVNLNDNGGSGSGLMTGGAAQKTYALGIQVNRPAASPASGDSNDAIIRGTYNNYAPNDTNFIVRGPNTTVSNRSGGTLGILSGGLISASSKSGSTSPYVKGLEVNVENFGTNATEHGGLDVTLKNEGAKATSEYGARFRNLNNSIAGPADAVILVTEPSLANTGWNFIIDANGVKSPVGAFARMQSGAGIYSGTGDPNGALSATDGSIYLRTGTATASTILYVCTGTTTWTAVTVP